MPNLRDRVRDVFRALGEDSGLPEPPPEPVAIEKSESAPAPVSSLPVPVPQAEPLSGAMGLSKAEAEAPAEVKASRAAGAILSILGLKQAVWTRQNYEAYAREGYGMNVYVHRCIEMIATACSDIPWVLYEGSPHGKKVKVDDHEIHDLLDNPCPDLVGYPSFMEHYVGYLMLSGNTYLEKVGPKGKPPRELYPHRPDRIRIVPGNIQQRILCYNYFANSVSTAYAGDPDNQIPAKFMLHQKFFHPYDDWYGMAPIQAAARAADQVNASKAWNVSMLQNSARPSGAFMLKEGLNLTPEEFDDLQRTIEDAYTGTRNAGKPFLLEAELEYIQMSLTPKDMDWLEAQKLSSREIALIFGIPPELITDNSSKVFSDTSGNTAYKMLYVMKILPLMRMIRDAWNRFIVADFQTATRRSKRLFLDIDRDRVEVLQEDRKILWEYIKDATFLTENDKRQMLGLETADWGETRVFQSGAFEISTDGTVTAALPLAQAAVTGGAAAPPAKPKPAAPKKPAKKDESGFPETMRKAAVIAEMLGLEAKRVEEAEEAEERAAEEKEENRNRRIKEK